MSSFTAGGLNMVVNDGRLVIWKEGRVNKFVAGDPRGRLQRRWASWCTGTTSRSGASLPSDPTG